MMIQKKKLIKSPFSKTKKMQSLFFLGNNFFSGTLDPIRERKREGKGLMAKQIRIEFFFRKKTDSRKKNPIINLVDILYVYIEEFD